jgi:hypothetical protein
MGEREHLISLNLRFLKYTGTQSKNISLDLFSFILLTLAWDNFKAILCQGIEKFVLQKVLRKISTLNTTIAK